LLLIGAFPGTVFNDASRSWVFGATISNGRDIPRRRSGAA
jgi:hypothetical protein